jgi:hypothetical protein
MHVSNMMLRTLPNTFDTLYSLFTMGLCIWVVLLSLQSPNIIILILTNDLWNQWLK